MTDSAARSNASSRRTLASSNGSHTGVRWVLEEGPDGGVVLSPRPWSWKVEAYLACLYLAFGIGWTVMVIKAGGPAWAAAVGLPLMTGVTVLVVAFYRHAGSAEVERGPVLTWSPSSRTLSLPRKGVSIPRERLVAIELFGHWQRISDTLVRTRVLDVVVRDEDARTTTRHTIVADATKLARLGEELSRRTGVPLERIRR